MSVVHERSNVVLRSPAEFAAAIPALLGFSPEDSLVAVFLGEGQVIVTMTWPRTSRRSPVTSQRPGGGSVRTRRSLPCAARRPVTGCRIARESTG